MTQVTIINTYSDDGTTAKDMRNGGFRTYLLQMLSEVMVSINALLSGSFTTGVRVVTGTGAQTVAQSDAVTVWKPTVPADVTFTVPASPAAGERHSFKYGLSAGQLFGMTLSGNGHNIDGQATITLRSPLQNLALVYSSTDTEWKIEWDYAPDAPAPRPDLIFNGYMEIDQRNEGASVSLASGTAKYIVDGWQVLYNSTASGVTAQRVTDAPAGAANSLKITVGTGAAVGAGNYLIARQPIEANELVEAGFGAAGALPVAILIDVKSSIAAYVMSGALTNFAGTRSYPLNWTIVSSGAWTTLKAVIPGDVAGSWVTSGTAGGAYLVVCIAAGSTFQGAANTWGAGNFYGTASNTNTILSTNGATFQLSKVGLKLSPVPTPLGREAAAVQFVRCQRHFRKSYSPGVAVGGASSLLGAGIYPQWGTTANQYNGCSTFGNPMRAPPTVAIYSPVTGAVGNADNNNVDIAAQAVGIGQNGFEMLPNSHVPAVGGYLRWHYTAEAGL